MRLLPQQLSNIKLGEDCPVSLLLHTVLYMIIVEPQLLKLGVVVKNFPLEKTLVLTNDNSQCIRLCLEVINSQLLFSCIYASFFLL